MKIAGRIVARVRYVLRWPPDWLTKWAFLAVCAKYLLTRGA